MNQESSTRLFLVLIISMLTVFSWNYFYIKPQADAQRQAQLEAQANAPKADSAPTNDPKAPLDVVANKVKEDVVSPTASTSLPEGESVSAVVKNSASTRDRIDVISEDRAAELRVPVKTKRLHGSINLRGAVFDDLTLAEYHETLDKTSPEVVLLAPRGTKELYFLNTGWVSSQVAVPNDSTIWRLKDGVELTPETPVTLEYDNGQGQLFTKTISIDDRQLITVKLSVLNRSNVAASVAPFGLINRTWDLEREQVYVSHEGMIAVTDKILNEAKYKALVEDGNHEFRGVSGWAGIGDKYWLTALIPQDSSKEKFDISFKYYKKDDVNRFQTDILAKPVEIAPESFSEYTFSIYAGAKKLNFMEKYQESLNIDLFDRAIDFGWFYFLTKPIFKALTFFHDLVGNMGVAILILTVCIRLILFPLANKSYGSMARMKKHMPEIQKLKAKHKDRQKQGQEMMKYYREHKINPAAGCLPLLVQIPVFFSLYKVLYVTIEMRHAPFMMWIHDLSVADPTNIFTLFGLLAWNVPAWLPHIGVLPILFSFTMWLQQKLNPTALQDEAQRVMMAWLPWIFLFLFSGFAAGLVLYWVWNNILSILQQYIITRRVEEDKNQ